MASNRPKRKAAEAAMQSMSNLIYHDAGNLSEEYEPVNRPPRGSKGKSPAKKPHVIGEDDSEDTKSGLEEVFADEDVEATIDDDIDSDSAAPTSYKGRGSRAKAQRAGFLQAHGSRMMQKLHFTKADIASGGSRFDERDLGESAPESSKSAAVKGSLVEAYTTEPSTMAEIDAVIELRNVKRLKKKLEVLELVKKVDPPAPVKDFFKQIRSAEPVDGSEFGVSAIYEEDSKWVVEICDLKDKTNRVNRGKKAGTTRVYTSRITLETDMAADEATAKGLMEEYCRLLERFPYKWEKKKSAPVFMRWLLETAKRNTDPQWKASLPNVRYRDSKNCGRAFLVRFKYFVVGTGLFDHYIVNSPHSKVDLSLPPPPPLPSWIKDQELEYPEGFSEAQREVHLRCFMITRYIAFRLRGQIGTAESIKASVNNFREILINTKLTRLGPYGGQSLLKIAVTIKGRFTSVGPSKAVFQSFKTLDPQAVKVGLPFIIIKGLSRSRGKQVASAITQTWCRVGDICEAWRVGCMTADFLNQQPVEFEGPETTGCGCTEEMSQVEIHNCVLCGRGAFCASLQFSQMLQTRVCTNCSDTRVVTPCKTTRWLRKCLASSLYEDQNARQIPTIERKAELQEMWGKFLEEIRDPLTNEIKSELTGRQFPPTNETMLGNPSQAASIDAAFPFVRVGDKLRYHCAGNLCLMEQTLNRLKWRYPPGTLQFLSDWMHSEKDETSVAEIFARMNEVAKVIVSVPFSKRTRLSQELSDKSYDAIQQEFLTCKRCRPLKTREIEKLQRYTSDKYKAGPPRPGFVPMGYERVKRLIRQIETKYAYTEKTLRRKGDCPFPFSCKIPDDWSWWTAWVLFGERLCRMWLMCNSLWTQVECTETLFLECIIQFFEPSRYDPLGLPLSIFECNPLKFSVGKINHSKGMQTRFTTHTPQDLDEDVDVTKANISFEPWIVNIMKSNLDASQYAEMAELVKRVAVPVRWFQPLSDESVRVVESTAEEPDRVDDDGSIDSDDNYEFDDDMQVDDDLYPEFIANDVGDEEEEEQDNIEAVATV